MLRRMPGPLPRSAGCALLAFASAALASALGCDDGATTTSAGGAGGSGGIGEPSDVYPAPHPDPPQVLDTGGPILAAPTMVPVVFAGDDPMRVATIEALATNVGPSEYWKTTTAEYGVGSLAIHPTVALTETVPPKISPTEIETWLVAHLDAGDNGLPAAFDGAIYVLFYPPGVSVEDANGVACTSYSGYHGSVKLDAAHATADVAYAVIPPCKSFYGETELETLTSSTTHELIEAATDPYWATGVPAYETIDDAHAVWTFVYGGGEVSDMCNLPVDSNVTLPGTTFRVQRSWSNAAALAGHDPCVPALPGEIYFAAAPELTDDVLLPNGVTAKGVRVAKGSTRTIDVRLYSEAPTAPIRVVPEDYTLLVGGDPQLEMTLDEARGLNGQTLHLRIKVVGDAPTQIFRLSATDGTQWTSWMGVVSR
jgi:hypothetical protein